MAEDAGRDHQPYDARIGQVHGGSRGNRQRVARGDYLYDENGGILRPRHWPIICRRLRARSRKSSSITSETPSANSDHSKAKGLGEGGTIGAPAAVINAINDALSPFGVEIDEMPATPSASRRSAQSGESAQ